MAERTADIPDFGRWLRAMAEAAALSASRLHAQYILEGGSGSEKTTARWLRGDTEPKASEATRLIRALHRSIDGLDVFAEYARFQKTGRIPHIEARVRVVSRG